jgi:GNAT superfamily N-acetyltransferase
LRKVGWGRDACWRLGTFDDLSNLLALDVDFALDRNPDEPCCKLLFVNRTSEKRRRVGYMLLAAKEDASALRGMQISEDLRGRGLSRVLLAAWLRMCITASLQPTTGTINKPLLALTLDRFGFEPVNRRGRQVRVHAGTRRLTNCRGWQDERGETPLEGQYRTAFVRTPFEVARPDALEAAVDETLGDHFVLEADGEALRRALTLRGGWRSTGPLDLRFVMTRRRVASARPVQ